MVTPRRGKAVEINAIWQNALRLMEVWARAAWGDDATSPYHPRARSSGIAATRRELTDALPALPGARLEFKGLSLALHYRGVRPERWPDVEEIAASVLRRRRELTAIQGHRIFDFMPRIGWDKGQAARWMVKRMAPTLPNGRVVVLYVGDDTTDESAFTALRGRALTIRVGTCSFADEALTKVAPGGSASTTRTRSST